MQHLVSILGFLTVAIAAGGVIVAMLASYREAIVAALAMREPTPVLPVHARRVRVRSVYAVATAAPLSQARRRAA